MDSKTEKISGLILLIVILIGGYLYFTAKGEPINVCKPGEICADVSTTTTASRKSAIIKITSTDPIASLADKAKRYKLAPEIANPSGFVNTMGKPITITEFKNKKVVLIDFWTYTCINCQRTLPYLNAWYEKYKDEGLEIISIHTPEFAFEKLQKNVETAASEFAIKYPIVMDNDFATWRAFGNQYWPRKYLVDIDGYIVYDHIGEGNYAETERAIQKALLERTEKLKDNKEVTNTISDPSGKVAVDTSKLGSPETYFGSLRNEYFLNGKSRVAGEGTYIVPSSIRQNGLYLGGTWNITPEYAENKGEASIIYKYKAKNIYLVMSSYEGASIEVLRDGVLVKNLAGEAINKTTSLGAVKEEKLYKIIEGDDYKEHTLLIRIKSGNLKAFAFTFG